MAKLNACKMVL